MCPPVLGPARGQRPCAPVFAQLIPPQPTGLAAPLSEQQEQAQRWPKWLAQVTRCAPQPTDLSIGQHALSRRASSRFPDTGARISGCEPLLNCPAEEFAKAQQRHARRAV